jgi:uncharacterized protein
MDTTVRVLTWSADPAAGEARFEQVHVRGGAAGLRARGTLLVGAGELTEVDGPFRVDYELHTVAGWAHHRLAIRAEGAGWWRELSLRRDAAGTWTGWRATDPADSRPAVPDLAALTGAVDCDLVSSALFNMMPIARSGLHRRTGRRDFRMAWVSVPDLLVTPSRQTYGHVRPGVVSFGSEDGFTADIEVDDAGYVLRYPLVAVRVPETTSTTLGSSSRQPAGDSSRDGPRRGVRTGPSAPR